jgi:hypothetical protein
MPFMAAQLSFPLSFASRLWASRRSIQPYRPIYKQLPFLYIQGAIGLFAQQINEGNGRRKTCLKAKTFREARPTAWKVP